jgi:hypothetical protein
MSDTGEAGDFEVLHAIRLRGLVPTATLVEIVGASEADLAGPLSRLTDEGSIFFRDGRRLSGYALTEDGRARHADRLAAWAAGGPVREMEDVYDSFLDFNGTLKTMCSAWQQIGEDPAARWEAVDGLEGLHAKAATVFAAAGALVPRFTRYADRLSGAVAVLKAGDERYFTSPTVDSYHTVWFEAHEDFLLVLGRDRATEGSF